MEPKIDIFVLAPEMLFEEWEIDIAEERLAGFAHVIHGNQDVGVFRPTDIVNYKDDPEKKGKVISDTISLIMKEKPDEIFTVDKAWDCDEIRIIRDFCKVAGIKVVEFDLDVVIPDGSRKMYKKQEELYDKKVAEEKDLLNAISHAIKE
jgi:hypothetical protein